MRRKLTPRYRTFAAAMWDTCEEIVTNRWFDVIALFKLHGTRR